MPDLLLAAHRRCLVLLWVLAGALLPAGAPAAGQESPATAAWGDSSFAASDYDATVLAWLEAVVRDPADPGAEALLRGASELRGRMVDFQRMRPLLERAWADASLSGFSRILVGEMLADCHEEAGEFDAAQAVFADLGALRRWCVIGGFGTTTRACFDEAYPPEVRPDDPELAVGATEFDLAWRAAPPPGLRRGFDPFDFLSPRRGAAYALAQFRLDSPADAVLTLSCPGNLRAWVNDLPALVFDRFRAYGPRERAVGIRLRPGWNRILVKTVAGSISNFRAFLTDRTGRPIRPAEIEEAATLRTLAPAPEPESAPVTPFEWPAWAHFARIGSAPAGLPAREVALAAAHALWRGHADEAVFRVRAALESGKDDPLVQYTAAEIFRQADPWPDLWRRNRAYDHYRRAIESAPAFAPAWLALADLLEADHKIDEALEALRRAATAHPRAYAPHFQLMQLYRGRGWNAQAETAIRRMEELAPGTTAVANYWIDRRRDERNYPAALEWARKLVARRAGTVFQLTGLLEAAGEQEEAARLWRGLAARAPDDAQILRRLAALEESLGRPVEAEECWRRLLKWDPRAADAWRSLGDVRLRAGNRAGALEAYRTALSLEPSDAALRRELAWLDAGGSAAGDRVIGDPDEFWAPYKIDVARLIPGSPRRRDLPTSSVVYLLDQAVLRIHPDGSHSEYIHQAVKILNERGVDEYDKVNIEGEILEARTFAPDGSVLEPVVIPRERELTMPRVTEGSVIDYAFRRVARGRPLGRFTYPNFYFQDPNFDGTFLISELVVLVPKGFPFLAAEMNMPRPAQVSERDGMVVHRWRIENAPHIEPEGHMPHFRTLLPYVAVGAEQTWRDVWADLRENFMGRCVPTHDLQAFVDRVCAGKTTRRERTEALYYAVLDHVRDTGGFAPAHTVFLERSGHRLVLLKPLLDLAGVPAEFAATRPNAHVEPPPPWHLPRPDHFDGASVGGLLLRVRLDDRESVWLSGAGRYLPFGEIPGDRRGGFALLLGAEGPELVTLPTGDPTVYRTAAERVLGTIQDFVIEPSLDGPAALTCRTMATGPESSFWKERFAGVDAARRKIFLETIYNATFPGLVVDAMEFPDLEEARRPFTGEFSLRIRSFLTQQGDRAHCGLGVVPLRLQRAFVAESKRRLPIHLEETYGSSTTVLVRVPSGLRVRRLPESVTLRTDFGSYSLRIARVVDPAEAGAAGAVRVTREYEIPAQDVPAEAYGRFIEFCRAVDQAETQRIVFERER